MTLPKSTPTEFITTSVRTVVPRRIGLPSGWTPPGRRRVIDAIASRSRRFQDAAVIIPGAVLLFVVVACFFGPQLLGLPDPTKGNLADYLLPVGSPGHPLGTNALGNDILAQILVGGRVSLTVAAGATLIGLVFGTLVGMLAGYFEKVLGAVLMRVMDVIFAFPDIILALAIAAYLGPSVQNAIFAIGFFSIAGYGRITRAQTIRVANRDFVVGARAGGSPTWRILLTHIWPNISGRVLSYAFVVAGHAMMAEAALSFLGLGVPVPTPSWGNIIDTSRSFLSVAPAPIIVTALMLFLTIGSVNLLSDGLQAKRAARR